MANIVKPTWPPLDSDTDIYEYLASVGFSESMFKSLCVKEAIVTEVASLTTSTVTIEMDSIEYTDVPVWVHTDRGCRRRVILGTEANDPKSYFEGVGALFPMRGSSYHESVPYQWFGLPGWGEVTRTPRVMVLSYISDEIVYVLGVVSIIDSGVYESGGNSIFDRRTYAHPTFSPMVLLYETTGSVRSFSLFDLLTGEIASIPNIDYTAFIDAEGLYPLDYNYVFEGAFQERFSSSNYYESFCHVVDPDDSTPSGVGDVTNIGGCTCNGAPLAPESWHCTSYANEYTYTWEDSCEAGAFVNSSIDSPYTAEINIPTSAGASYGATGDIYGKRIITWATRERTDAFDLTYYKPLGLAATGRITTIKVNSETFSFDAMVDAVEGSRIIFDTVGTNFFSFSLVQTLMTRSGGSPTSYESIGELIHDNTPSSGIITNGLVDFIAERYETLKMAHPSDLVEIEPRIVFIPYNIRQQLIGI